MWECLIYVFSETLTTAWQTHSGVRLFEPGRAGQAPQDARSRRGRLRGVLQVEGRPRGGETVRTGESTRQGLTKNCLVERLLVSFASMSCTFSSGESTALHALRGAIYVLIAPCLQPD